MPLNAVKLPHKAASADKKTAKLVAPKKVIVSLWQNIGAPCEPLVKVGDEVLTGQVIGDSDAFTSAPVHASVSGTVADETEVLSVSGRLSRALVINASSRQNIHKDVKPPVVTDRESFLKAVRASGSVGLGGAGFPTHVKLSYDPHKKVEKIVINAAECEPYLTGDYREIIENVKNIIWGIELIMFYLGIPEAVIGVERDKKLAIEKLKESVVNCPHIKIKPLPAKYPQGAEKILIYNTTKKLIKEGELPLNAGCLVMNVSTVAFIAEYIKTGVPLIKRRVTIDGDIVNDPKNVFVPIGTTLEELLKIANLRKTPERVIFGGPMMGFCAYNLNQPVTKTSGALLLFGKALSASAAPCIRCGKCVSACSMNLSPVEINKAYDRKDRELLRKLRVSLCMNCAACSYVCPAKRAVAEKNQLAKQLTR